MVAAPLAAASSADADDYYWYVPNYGNYNLIQKTTYLAGPEYHWSEVGANHLSNHMIGEGAIGGKGGIGGMLQATDYGDYCAAAQTGPMASRTDLQYGWYVTGFTPTVPPTGSLADYQRNNGQSAGSACQAQGGGWGQYLGNDGRTNCSSGGEACGIFHYVSMAQSNDRPWHSGFTGGNPRLHVRSTYHVHLFQDPTPETRDANAASCVVLQDTSINAYLELCFNKWQSNAYNGYVPNFPVKDGAQDCAGNIGTVWFTLPTATGANYATQVGSQGSQWDGALGTRTVEFSIDKGQLKNLALRANDKCKWNPGFSTDATVYRLIGLEDGMEIGQTGVTHFGMNQESFAAWTRY